MALQDIARLIKVVQWKAYDPVVFVLWWACVPSRVQGVSIGETVVAPPSGMDWLHVRDADARKGRVKGLDMLRAQL